MEYTNLSDKCISLNCTVCNNDNYTTKYNIPPRRIVECLNCGHEYINPVLNSKNILPYAFPTAEEDSINTQIDIKYISGIFQKYNFKPTKILDVGCGQGRLIKKLSNLNFSPDNIYMMDIDPVNLDFVKNKYPLCKTIKGDIGEGIGAKNYFDCILMVELLEHLANPRKSIKYALDALKNEGLLIIRGLPNNNSLEAHIGKDQWKMRQFINHLHFFNHSTFSTFALNFPEANILEFGTFLQVGYKFYNIERVARNIGIVKESKGTQHMTYEGNLVNSSKLSELVLIKIKHTNFENFKHKDKLSLQQIVSLLSENSIEQFFDSISLDSFLAPDFSVVIQKREI